MVSRYRGSAPSRGRYSDSTKMIVKTAGIEAIKSRYPAEKEEDGRECVTLSFRFPRMQKPQYLMLTHMTEEELEAVKSVIDSAFEEARPLCIQYDKEAKDAYDAGDDSDPRVYRAAPLVVDREGGKRPHSALLRERPAPVPSVDGPGDGGPDGGVRDVRSGMAEPAPEGVGSQDNSAP